MKNEIEIQFDKMKKEGEDQMKEVTTSLKNEISALNELLSSIKYNAEEGHYNDKVETVDEVQQIINQKYSGNRTYKYPEYTTSAARVSTVFGTIAKRQFTVKLQPKWTGEHSYPSVPS